MNKDLTMGEPRVVLRQFCLPLFGSVIFQQLYNIADSLIAGKFVGENALAAVGNSYEITLIFIAIAFGCNIGCSVITSQLFGAGEQREMKTAISTAFLFSGTLCLLLMLLGFGGGSALLHLIHTPQAVFSDSKLYLDIYLLGLPFVFFYNLSTGVFSALGDSKTPFYFLAVSSTANIAVDLLFVIAFGMGVAGVAWATFLCQGVSCLLALLFLFRRLKSIPQTGKVVWFSPHLLKKIVAIALPSAIQQSFISVGNIIIQGEINRFGAPVMAGYSASVKLNNLVITSFTTLGNGISNFTAQNIGAGKRERVKAGLGAGLRLVWTIGLPLSLLYFFGGSLLLTLFLEDGSALALQTGIVFLRILSPFYFVVSAKLVSDGILRGASRMKEFMTCTLVDLFLRVALAVVLSHTPLGATGIWMAWPLGWFVGAGISLVACRKILWKNPLV